MDKTVKKPAGTGRSIIHAFRMPLNTDKEGMAVCLQSLDYLIGGPSGRDKMRGWMFDVLVVKTIGKGVFSVNII